ncbi:hypothetical protein BESB_003980 [Besnoitia besnoiti]|uniref:Transmembrane protein n=1 Tax=Besnoitia besnoiti TaxID=94643 RepID=A0A2A9MPQ2_BESBE|nr:hypothetical protein BESB_003980 [Besnoitia besnoiti]PFH38057.1 hypothetical protein BESB_003980 [Besnoitia besnoiti]
MDSHQEQEHHTRPDVHDLHMSGVGICTRSTDDSLIQTREREVQDTLNCQKQCDHGETPVQEQFSHRAAALAARSNGADGPAAATFVPNEPEPEAHADGGGCSPGQADDDSAPPMEDISLLPSESDETAAKNSTDSIPLRSSQSVAERAQGSGGRDHMVERLEERDETFPASKKPALQSIPFAVSSPSYWSHLCYELSLTRRFWSCNLRHRDWRQVFVSSYFPNLINVTALVVIRLVLCVVLLLLESFASCDVTKDLGWPMVLYFTNWNSYATTIYFFFLCVVSVRAAWSFRIRLSSADLGVEERNNARFSASHVSALADGNVREENAPPATSEVRGACMEATTDSQKSSVNDCSTSATTEGGLTPKQHSYPPSTAGKSDRKWFCIRHHHVAHTLSSDSMRDGKGAGCASLRGYDDLMAHPQFCVEGILLAPNPSYPESIVENCVRRKRRSLSQDGQMRSDAWKQEAGGESAEEPPVPFLVSIVWILHSIQLVASLGVFLIFFALLEQNGNTFPEAWYSVWKHLLIVLVTLMHSLLLSRIPVPVRHAVFCYIFIMVYLGIQVVVFFLNLPNGDGGHGYIYRVFDMRYPARTFGVAVLVLSSIAVLTVALWSASRQRSLFVDPPPSVTVSASTYMEIRAKELNAKMHELHISVDRGVGDCRLD